MSVDADKHTEQPAPIASEFQIAPSRLLPETQRHAAPTVVNHPTGKTARDSKEAMRQIGQTFLDEWEQAEPHKADGVRFDRLTTPAR